MTDREQAIKTLEDMINIAESLKNRDFIPKTIILDEKKVESLKFALESIKTDKGEMGKWIVEYNSPFPHRELECRCDKCGKLKLGYYRDLACGDREKYEMPNYCDNCGDKKSNTVIYPID